VIEQSAIRAGDGGFAIDVNGNTDLTGAAITSTQAAIDASKNSLSTAALRTSDIQNKDEHSASAFSVSASFSGKVGDQEGAAARQKMADERGEATPQRMSEADMRAATAATSPGGSAGIGSDSGSQTSTTAGGISGAAITITDDAAQRALTGTSGADAVAAIKRDVRTDAATSNALAKAWNGAQLLQDVQAQTQITAAFGQTAARRIGDYAGKQAEQLRQQGNEEEARKWDEGGVYRVAAHTAMGALAGGAGGALGAGASAAAVPVIADAVNAMDLPEPVRQAVIAAAGTAVGAVAGSTAGAASALNQTLNNYLKHEQWEQLAKDRANCKGDAHCESSVDQAYAQLSRAQDNALATCDIRGDCTTLKQEVASGTERQMQLIEAGQLPQQFAGAANLQSMGEKLAGNATLRAQVAQAMTAKYICDTDPQRCDSQAARAAAGLALTVVGGPVVAELLASAPSIAAAAKLSLDACLSNLVLCANRAGIAAADLTAGDALGGASLAGGVVVAGKVAGKVADEAVDAARNAERVAEEAAALRAIAQNNGTLAAKADNSFLSRGDALLANDLAARTKVRPDISNDAYYAANTDQSVLKNNNFDMGHVLAGEINAGGKATGYHAEFAADGAARITPGATVTPNANGTYEAPVQIWNDSTKQWGG
jgi:hypothetical protein